MENSSTPNLSNTGAASALIGDPAKFGRVGEDGTVYVITPTGDRAVGSYPGKSSDEALAYFVKKFEMAASEVALLAARIRSMKALTRHVKQRRQLKENCAKMKLLPLKRKLLLKLKV